MAMILWRRAYPEVDHQGVIDEVIGHSLAKHIERVPVLIEGEVRFSTDYTYKR